MKSSTASKNETFSKSVETHATSKRPIDRTPDEDEFQMTLIPETKIMFRSDNLDKEPAVTVVTIFNDTPFRQAFKIKCTANSMFTIKPASGFLAPNEKTEITITFQNKEIPQDDFHFISFYHVHAEETDDKPRKLFEKFRPEGVKRVQVRFAYADGRPIHPAPAGKEGESVTPAAEHTLRTITMDA